MPPVIPAKIKLQIYKKEEELEILKADIKDFQAEIAEKDMKFLEFLERFQRHERDFWTMVNAILEEIKKKWKK